MDTHIIAEWFATARQILKMCLFSVFYQLLGLVKGLLCFDSILIEARFYNGSPDLYIKEKHLASQ